MVEVGQIISGKYKLLRLLGDGGMGSVFEAEHVSLGTHVAIKVLHADLARRTGIAQRFVQEARVSAQIRSVHVVLVTDVDSTPDGVAYLVMELLQGETLSGVLRRERKLAVPTACEYTTQILQALEAAHALGVIHRDLKPDNVFVTFTGGKPVLKLIDFGIAKLKTEQTGKTKNLTVAGMLMGTPEYMAPEQAYSAGTVDVRADIYAVGVMLYEMLAGVPPVEAGDPRVLIGKVERGEITPLVQAAPGIAAPLAGLVHRAMAPRPELRFATATEMRLALEDIATGKRAGTAQLGAAAPAAAASVVAPVPLSLAQTSPKGTGTAVGAPIEAAFSMTPQPRGATEAVAAMPMMNGPGQMSGAQYGTGPPPPQIYAAPPAYPPPVAQYEPARRKGGSGLIIALAAVALLLGAGAVVTYMLQSGPSTPTVPTVLNLPTNPPTVPTVPIPGTTTTIPVTPTIPVPPGPHPGPAPGPHPGPAHHDGGAPAQDGGAPRTPDAGAPGQTVIVTPFGTFQFPGPRPLFYPADQPWPPPTITPIPAPP